MKAIVHIGIEKTGSSSIQEYLYQNQELLKESGFYFVQSAGIRNNRSLSACCVEDDEKDNFFRRKKFNSQKAINEFKQNFFREFDDEIKSIPKEIDTVVISSEHFHSRTNTQDEVDNVYKLLSSYFSEIKIVCYLREQTATSISLYSTAIKSGFSTPLHLFLRSCHPGNIYYNYYDMLMHWEKAFGLESLDVALFDRNKFLNGDLLDDFTARINSDLVGTLNKEFSAQNESLNYAGQIFGKAINKALSKNSDLNPTRLKCQKILYQECKGKGEGASLSVRNKIFQEFADSNEKLRKKFFPEIKALFEPPTDETEVDKTINESFVNTLSDIFNIIIEENRKNILPDRYAVLFRDVALKMEKDNLESAFEIMSLAHKIRPSAQFIGDKLKEYSKRLKEENK